MRSVPHALTRALNPLVWLAVASGCRGGAPIPAATGGGTSAGGDQASGGTLGGSGAGAGGAGTGGTAAAGAGGDRAWQAQACDPGEFPAGMWTPSPWQAHEDDPTCQHVPVEAKCEDGWCQIPAGCYVGGSSPADYGAPVDSAQHTVRFTRSFEMQQTEFARELWLALGFDEPGQLKGDLPCRVSECPVSLVTWHSALAAANALSEARGRPACYELSGCNKEPGNLAFSCTSVKLTTESVYDCAGYRLPAQAEWEYAYRAGTQTAYYSGNVKDNGPFPGDTNCYDDPNLSKIGWYCSNTDDVQPSKCRQPNRWGLYDIAGNLPEWASSSTRVLSGPATDPQAALDSSEPTLAHTLGGSVYLWPAACGASFAPTTAPSGWSGFRLVRTLNP